MLNALKKNLWSAICSFWSLLVALFWLALRVNWSGMSKVLGADKNQSFLIMQFPLLLCILFWIIFVLSLLAMLLLPKKRWTKITLTALLSLFTVGITVVILMGSIDYIQFILPNFFTSLIASLLIVAFALLLFFPPTKKCKLCTALKCALVALIVGIGIFAGYGITFGSYFTYEAVVYAVEDEYQIVFSTNDSAIAWVEVDGEKYFDLYGGSMKSKDKVHKISIPQEKLDSARSYSIHAQKMIYRGPFGGYTGEEITKSYDFRPVDSSDGLVYYSMSDVHHARSGATAAASSVEGLDFLIILGDSVGMTDTEADAQFSNLLAFDVTGGEIPVVYVRGNHEIKGEYAEELHKYVGSKNGNFYYWFTLSDVYGITLDLGEDHDDDWWEYYGTAQFSVYQAEQTEMLREILAEKPYLDYSYTLVASHIPIQFVNSRKNHTEIKAEWTALLNEISPDLAVYGHQHDLYPFLDGQETLYTDDGKLQYNSQFKENKTYGGYLTDFEFNGFIVGKRGDTQTDEPSSLNRTKHIGLVTSVDLEGGTQTCKYINSSGDAVSVFNPFVEGEAQTEFVLTLK